MGLTPEAQSLAVIVTVVVCLWVTEALPLAVTALLGAVACVLAGVAPAQEVFRPFADPLIFLFIGSFLLAEAIRQHGLDRRLAFRVLSLPWVDDRPRRILAAVAVITATISAFISNTCTAAMMIAIVSGILVAVEESARRSGRPPVPAFATALFLCIAFAASIGGLATPIGTPPNLIGLGFIKRQLGVEVSFLEWVGIGMPIVVALIWFMVLLLARMFPAGVERLDGVGDYVASERVRLGAWTIGQWSVATAFVITVVLWVLPGIAGVMLGPTPAALWIKERLPEGVAALIGGILLFVLPGGRRDGRLVAALEWGDARIDWGIVLLYGGGMALGELCFSTGLAEAVGSVATGWIPAGPWAGVALVATATLLGIVTSEFTSNTASATMIVPVVIAIGAHTGGDNLVAALAATFACSLGFMMPVSTPCNALVYGTGRIPLRAMMRSGVVLDVVGAFVIVGVLLAFSRLAGI
ncbi:MAG: SLC13 family permease [Pirellulales bacterium]